MTAEHPTPPPAASAEAARAFMASQLSTSTRLAHLALLLVALTMSVAVGSLLATEPALPLRTQLAFGAMLAIGLGWVGFASWVLTTRQVLFGRHRVVAGRMAVTFTSVFAVSSLLVAVTTGQPSAYMAAGPGVLMVGAAVWMLARARRAVARLTTRRMQLERELAARR